MDDQQMLTTGDVVKHCKVSFNTVHRWIENGHLKAYQNPGGGNNRIEVRDFLDFLNENNMPIPDEFQERAPRVLIVEDELPMTKSIQRALKRAGFETEIALDGFKAGLLLESFSPTVMTLDLKMPGMSGLEVIKQVRATPHLAHVKILIVSGLAQEDLEEALATGADDVLEKPFANKALVEKVSRLAGVMRNIQAPMEGKS